MLKFNNIIFFNNFHNGDIHVSRSFVKNIISQLNSDNYIYAHNNSSKLLADICNLQHKNIGFKTDNSLPYKIDNNNLYINTWIGQNNHKYIQNGCNFIGNYRLYTDLSKELNYKLSDNIEDYLPKIDYNFYNIKNIDLFFEHNNKTSVFISNCETKSGQCANFNFDPIIDWLSNKYSNLLFILDDKTSVKKHNVVISKDIILNNGNDLNENSYITTKCNVIIGRSSGSYTFSLVRENLIDDKKIFIVFCDNSGTGLWYKGEKSKTIYSERFDYNNVINVIDNILDKV